MTMTLAPMRKRLTSQLSKESVTKLKRKMTLTLVMRREFNQVSKCDATRLSKMTLDLRKMETSQWCK